MFEEKILKNIILKNAKIIDEKKFEFEFDYDNLSNVINTYGALKKYVEENCKED